MQLIITIIILKDLKTGKYYEFFSPPIIIGKKMEQNILNRS